MKNLVSIFLLFAFTILTVSVKAQQQHQRQQQRLFQSGLKGGLTLSNLYIDENDLDDENARVGFHIGIFTQAMFTDFIGIQPEILYNTKGSEAVYTGTINQTVDFRMNYIDVPVLLVIRPGEIFELHLGPYFGYLLNSDVRYDGTIEGETELDRDHFRDWDYGAAAGIALNFTGVKIGLRYNLGLQEVAETTVANTLLGDSKHQFLQLSISFNLAY